MVFTPRLKAVLLAFFCVLASVASAAPNPELAKRIKALKQGGGLEAQGAMIAGGGLIADFYARRAYTPVFDDNKIRGSRRCSTTISDKPSRVSSGDMAWPRMA